VFRSLHVAPIELGSDRVPGLSRFSGTPYLIPALTVTRTVVLRLVLDLVTPGDHDYHTYNPPKSTGTHAGPCLGPF